ncbi:class I SAM-dependent methyltransferase [Verrucosispora sioxanthis]|uniref:Class I SAM-dependent methyltransferase n=1 Tax=Verrucosispora sioxanthis TaxID=2499994 RepID=A0A6M1L7P6_9ACTN|nr:class I SAM-dependent methyltransferase [Verrucosispora sioxanthis]NEE65142.1 class I SAM-dependent methyltransferase [Verrucosispora sioxanthis]NGM14252.1 class I SAM-dependent methyltransferase [Verrucosispora sioxanthis]
MTKDWLQWHQAYDSPNSSLARRLHVVQHDLRRALTEAPHDEHGPRRLISICAGDGRDVLPVLAEHDGGRTIEALLIERDPTLSQRARTAAIGLGLPRIDVRTADAGATDTYLHIQPAHLLLACGVFGNITVNDVRRTIAMLHTLVLADGIVIWTRGRTDDGHDPSHDVRACFAEHGFSEMSFTSPADAKFRVGMHRLTTRPATVPPMPPGTRMFSFI